VISYPEMCAWQERRDERQHLNQLASDMAQELNFANHSKGGVDPGIYQEICVLTLELTRIHSIHLSLVFLDAGSVGTALWLCLETLKAFDNSQIEPCEEFSKVFGRMTELIPHAKEKEWDDRWIPGMRQTVQQHFPLLEMADLKPFLENAIDYQGIYDSGEAKNYEKDLFVGAESFESVYASAGQGLQGVMGFCFGAKLHKVADDAERLREGCYKLAEVMTVLDSAGVKIPTLQLDVLLAYQALERMAMWLEETRKPDEQATLFTGMHALVNVTLSKYGTPMRKSENFLRPHGQRKSWNVWMRSSLMNPMLNLLSRSITYWNGLAQHPGSKALAASQRLRIFQEAAEACRGAVKYNAISGSEIFDLKAASNRRGVITGIQSFVHSLGHQDLASLWEEETTSFLSSSSLMALTDVLDDVPGYKNHLLQKYHNIRGPKFIEDLGI